MPDDSSSLTRLPGSQPRLVIRASAGTGKTFQLSNRYIGLLRRAEPERILGSTFTRKAAGEILERVLLRLARGGLESDPLRELQEHVAPRLMHADCLRLLGELTRQLHRVRISTLDGFFARLAGSFSLELGLPPGWRIMEETEAAQLRDQAIDDVLRDGLQGGTPRDLVQLIHLLDKGSSRRSVHQLVSDKIQNFYDIYLNSSPESWNQFPSFYFLTEEQRANLIEQIQAVPLGDRRFATRRDKDCERMLAGDWDAVGTDGFYPKVMNGEQYYKRDIPAELAALYRQLEPQIRASLIAPLAHQTQATRRLLDHFHEAYERLKYEARGLRFDDITRRLAERLASRDTSEVTHRLDGEIDHVLLDEFQDTSPAQWRVIRPFSESACTAEGKTFFCVGDTKQAIYGWRGGEAAIFDAIERQLPGIATQPLNRSFRSSPVIIQTVNRIFSGIEQHGGLDAHLLPILETWSRTFPVHETARDTYPGYARLMTGPIPEGFTGGGNNTGPLTAALEEYTARYVADRLREAPGGTIGVLTRTNATVARLIYELGQIGIDASEEGGSHVTDSAGVQLILSLMTLADHPGDTIVRFHVARSPLGEALDYLDHLDDGLAHRFALEIRRRLAREGYGGVVHDLTQLLAPACNRRELRRLRQLSSLADAFDVSALTLRPSEFVGFVGSQKVQEPSRSQVRVMTVHQSKGLEFDTVVLAELDEHLTKPPSYVTLVPEPGAAPELVSLSVSKEAFAAMSGRLELAYQQTVCRQLNESLCMLYVASTRAVHALHMLILPSASKTPSPSFPKTFAGLLRAALAPESPAASEKVLFEAGDSLWFELVERLKLPTLAGAGRAAALPPSGSPRFAPGRGERRVERSAPSRKKKQAVRIADLLPSGNAEILLRGTLFHRWLEEIRWLEEGRPSETQLRRLTRQVGAQHLDFEECLRQFDQQLARPQIVRALSKSQYSVTADVPFPPAVREALAAPNVTLQVLNERRFALFEEGRLVNGSIDRLVLINSNGQPVAADVIDYKTDHIPDKPAVIRERKKHYAGQMTAYVEAVSRIYKLPVDRISARLVLLELGEVVAVTASSPAG